MENAEEKKIACSKSNDFEPVRGSPKSKICRKFEGKSSSENVYSDSLIFSDTNRKILSPIQMLCKISTRMVLIWMLKVPAWNIRLKCTHCIIIFDQHPASPHHRHHTTIMNQVVVFCTCVITMRNKESEEQESGSETKSNTCALATQKLCVW